MLKVFMKKLFLGNFYIKKSEQLAILMVFLYSALLRVYTALHPSPPAWCLSLHPNGWHTKRGGGVTYLVRLVLSHSF